METEQRDDSNPGPEVWVLLNAAAAPASDAGLMPGERAALEAFRERHLIGRRGVQRVRIRRGAGAVAVGVGLVLTSGTAAAATGVLPGPAQHFAHSWFDRIGISVPDAGTFIEHGGARDQRGVELPDQARRIMSPPSAAEGSGSLRPADAQAGTASPSADVHDPGSRAEQDRGLPASTYSQPSPEPAGHGTRPSATPEAPTSPGPAPATPPADPHVTPPADPKAIPPAAFGDQPRENSQDRSRDPSNPAAPEPAGASNSESPPAYQLDRDPPSEEPTQRRPR